MKDIELIIAFLVAILFGIGVIAGKNRWSKIQLALLIASTTYMLVHAVMYPETNSKFFAFLGIVFIVQKFKALKQQRHT